MVCEAACEVLRAGGNAFDAVIAGGFASAVAEPALTSLGGGGFLLARPTGGRARLFDFFSDTPGRGLPDHEIEPHFVPITVPFPGVDQVFHVGRGSVAVPGNLKGFLHVQRRLGRLPLAEVTAPAVELARAGVPLSQQQAYFLQLLRPIVTLGSEGRAIFAPRGELLCEGETLANPALAAFLTSLSAGAAEDFYRGELARRIAGDMREGQGLLSTEDLAGYRVIERDPLEVPYRGHKLLTNPPPSFGGSLLALSLRLLEAVDLGPSAAGSAQHALALLAVMEEVDTLRAAGRVEPAALGQEEGADIAQRVRRFSRGTTHISVSDAEGNAASMTTSNGEGSGYVVPGTGIMLNNMMGEDDLHPDGFHASPPGQRVASMMSPSLLLRDEDVRLVLGSGGSKRIRTALLQIVSLVVDYGLDVRAAVEHPRLHWDGDCVQVEPGFGDDVLAALRARRRVNQWRCRDVYFGGVNAVVPAGNGAGDSRRGGCALRG